MNSSGLNGNSLAVSALEPMDALRASAAGARGPGVATVDDNPLATPGADGGSLGAPHGPPHGSHHAPHHQLHHAPHHHAHGGHAHGGHGSQFPGGQAPAMIPYSDSLKLAETVAKLEHEAATMGQDMAYLRHVLDFQNSKVEKLTSLLIDLLHNKDISSIVTQLQAVQASDPFNVDDTHNSVDGSLSDGVHDSVHEQVHEVANALPALSSPGVVSVPGVSLETNMDPQLHQVAQAAVQAQDKPDDKGRKRSFDKGAMDRAKKSPRHQASAQGPGQNLQNHQNQNHQSQGLQNQGLQNQGLQNQGLQNQSLQNQSLQSINHPPHQQQGQNLPHGQSHEPLLPHQSQLSSRISSHSGHGIPARQSPPSEGQDRSQPKGNMLQPLPPVEVIEDPQFRRVKPKMTIEFVHNPMTVREIWVEFTKGYRGQPPLREMDETYGKYAWRGDSRTKQSKRFQRRRRLCEAIERGMEKYGKTADEIINYIEDFRGDKSLTWVMNGNLPEDIE